MYENNDVLCYEINANVTMFANKYTVTVHNNSVIPIDQVVYLTAILDSIKD